MKSRARLTKKVFLTAFAGLLFFCSSPLFADSKNLVYSQVFGIEDITELKISLDYEELHISQIYGDEISIEIGCNNLNRVPVVELEDEVLSVQSPGVHKTAKSFRAETGTVCTVYVYLPQDFLPESVEITMLGANLMAEVLRATTSILISSNSGRIDLMSCITESLTVKMCPAIQLYRKSRQIILILEVHQVCFLQNLPRLRLPVLIFKTRQARCSFIIQRM